MPSVIQEVDWVALGPALVVAVGALVLLLADLALPPSRYALLRWLTLAVLVAAGLLVVAQSGSTRSTFCSDDGAALVVCSYVADPVTRAFQLIALGGAGLVTLLPAGAPNRASGRLSGEYHFLLLASVAGAVSLAGARDLLTIVVALEVLSLPAFAMVALPADRPATDQAPVGGRQYGRPAAAARGGGLVAAIRGAGPRLDARGAEGADARGAEAALKAFLFSVVALAVMVVGIALLYGATGSLHLERIASQLVAGPAVGATIGPVAAVGAALTLAGLLFKVAAVPFHGWVPDAYAGAPVRVAAYLSVVSKTGGFAGLSVVLWYGLRPYGLTWGPVLAVLAAATMTIGNIGALRQTEPVRLLAWSSIAQSGFILVPLAAAGVTESTGDVARDGGAATVAYLAVYAVLNLGAFSVVTMLATDGNTEGAGAAAGSGAPDADFEVLPLAAYRGLGRVAPLTALGLAFCLVGLAGLPPAVAGLVAKVVVFDAAVSGGLAWLAVVMAVNVALGLAYYLRWTALLFAPPAGVRQPRPRVGPFRTATAAAVLCVAAGIALSIWPEATLSLL